MFTVLRLGHSSSKTVRISKYFAMFEQEEINRLRIYLSPSFMFLIFVFWSLNHFFLNFCQPLTPSGKKKSPDSTWKRIERKHWSKAENRKVFLIFRYWQLSLLSVKATKPEDPDSTKEFLTFSFYSECCYQNSALGGLQFSYCRQVRSSLGFDNCSRTKLMKANIISHTPVSLILLEV